MILVDFSSIVHRMVFSSVKIKLPELDASTGKYRTQDFITETLQMIIAELVNIHRTYTAEYGKMVLCFDDKTKKYWRKDVYPGYKSQRKELRDKNPVNYTEVFQEVDILIELLENCVPWKCVTVPKAEADDTILVLSRKFSPKEKKILIYSPDKDFIQAQYNTDNVFQYSALTNKWIVPEDKNEDMQDWIQKHVILGDVSDGVPKVVQHCEFHPEFLKHLKSSEIQLTEGSEVYEFKYTDKVPLDLKQKALQTYEFQKFNKKGEPLGLYIYKDVRFGPTDIVKMQKKHGSVQNFIKSNPLYEMNYDRNRILVLEEGIPDYIIQETLENYKNAPELYDTKCVLKYIHSKMMFGIEISFTQVLQSISGTKTETECISLENVNW